MTRFDPFAELVRFEPFRYPRAAWRAAPEIRMEDSVDAKAYRAEAEIPGVNNEDLKAAIAGNQVSGSEIDAGKAEAKLDNGALEHVLPKKEGVAPRHLAMPTCATRTPCCAATSATTPCVSWPSA